MMEEQWTLVRALVFILDCGIIHLDYLFMLYFIMLTMIERSLSVHLIEKLECASFSNASEKFFILSYLPYKRGLFLVPLLLIYHTIKGSQSSPMIFDVLPNITA